MLMSVLEWYLEVGCQRIKWTSNMFGFTQAASREIILCPTDMGPRGSTGRFNPRK